MAVSRALRRLLRVLTLEEEQSKRALEASTADLRRLENAATASTERERAGRRLVSSSAQTGQLPDRLAGLEEARAAKRFAALLAPRIDAAQSEVATLRQAFLAKRVECRQAETLIQEAEARDALEAGRRTQQNLDSWYLNRRHRNASTAAARTAPTPELYTESDVPEATALPRRENLSDDLLGPTIDVLNRENRSRF